MWTASDQPRAPLQRDVAVLLRRQRLPLGTKGTQRPGHVRPGLGGPDDSVDVPALGRDVGVEQRVLVLSDALLAQLHPLVLVSDRSKVTPVQDVYRAVGAHH